MMVAIVILAVLAVAAVLYFFWRLARHYAPLASSIDAREAELASEARQRSRVRELKAPFLDMRAPALSAETSRAARQVEAAFEIHGLYKRSLARKFKPGEMTHGRYLSTGEQLFQGVVENFHRLHALLSGLQSMEDASAGASASAEATEQRARVARLLDETDQALTTFAAANAALADLRTEGAPPALEASLDQMRVLAERAKAYEVE